MATMTSKKEASHKEQQPFRLFDLPDELWIKIGEMAIDSENPTDIGEMTQERLGDNYEECRQIFLERPAILQTCSALRNELRLRYYRNKVSITMYTDFEGHWHDESLRAVGAYLRLIGLEARQQINTNLEQYLPDHKKGFTSPPAWQSLREWDIELMLEMNRVELWHGGDHFMVWKVTFM